MGSNVSWGKPERDDMTPITTRAARAADAPEIVAMIRELGVFHDDVAEIEVEDLIFLCFAHAPWMTLLVAEQDGVLIGYAALQRRIQLQFARRLMDVQHLYVKQSKRGYGVGRALMDAANVEAIAQRCKGVTLGVMAQNSSAQEFYRSLGFEQRETSGAIQLMRGLELHAPLN